VLGTAALLMANFPQKLTSDPTLTRAVLMASASHAIPAGSNPPIPIYGDGIDDHSGAGAPRGDRAKRILSDDHFYSALVDQAVNFNSTGNLNVPLEIHSNPGDKVRVVLTYDQCQDATASIDDVLLADLDLIVSETYVSGGHAASIVHVNNSHVDNTEIVEFVSVAGQTGINLKVHVQHWDPCTDGTHQTHMSIAWDVLQPGTVAEKFNPEGNELVQRMETEAQQLERLDFRAIGPNPSAGAVHMEYELPRAGDVTLRVFDLAGRRVAELAAGTQRAGVHSVEWNATSRDGRKLAPGVYLVQLQMGPKSVLRRVVLTR
jgi:hypothetical protein